MPVAAPAEGEPVLMGIMAEILSEELAKEGVQAPFLELPAKSDPNSEERKKFWRDLEKAVQPRLFGGEEETDVQDDRGGGKV